MPDLKTPNFISTMLQHIATQPASLQQAETYFKLANIARDQADKNLPAALTAEVALKKYTSIPTQNAKRETQNEC